jgi:hypothetical protein
MADILQGIGNTGRFLGELAQNIADPQRQQFQRQQQLLRQKALFDAQSEFQRGSALNAANLERQEGINAATIEAANIKAQADRQTALGKIAGDTSLPPWMQEEAWLGLGVPADRIPRLEGLGPRQRDPAAFQQQLSPLDFSTIGRESAETANLLSQTDARRPPEPRARTKFDFFPPDFQFTGQQAAQAGGGIFNPPAGSRNLNPAGLPVNQELQGLFRALKSSEPELILDQFGRSTGEFTPATVPLNEATKAAYQQRIMEIIMPGLTPQAGAQGAPAAPARSLDSILADTEQRF